MTDSKLRAQGLGRGREGSEQKRSIILTNLRRELSSAGVKAQSACLFGRVARMEEGHSMAAKRRAWVMREEEIRQEASRAH